MVPHKRPASASASTQSSRQHKVLKTAASNENDAMVGTAIAGMKGKNDFFDLPREVQDMIYNYSYIYHYRRAVKTSQLAFRSCPKRPKPEPTISGTCKRARAECLSVYYSQVRICYENRPLFVVLGTSQYQPRNIIGLTRSDRTHSLS